MPSAATFSGKRSMVDRLSLPPSERGRSAAEARRVGVNFGAVDPSPARFARRPSPFRGGETPAQTTGRKKMKKTARFFGALSIAAIAFGASAALAAENVKIGVLMPLTGNAAAAGQASKAAIEVAAEIVNNAHPELS